MARAASVNESSKEEIDGGYYKIDIYISSEFSGIMEADDSNNKKNGLLSSAFLRSHIVFRVSNFIFVAVAGRNVINLKLPFVASSSPRNSTLPLMSPAKLIL